MNNFNKLTPAETERLALLSEECGEVIQAIGKILRHGYDNDWTRARIRSNKLDLEKECGDVGAAMLRLCHVGDLDWESIVERCKSRKKDGRTPLHHTPRYSVGREPAVSMTKIDTEELEALKKDAARYRYLRASKHFSGNKMYRLEWYLPRRFDDVDLGKQLDDGIDAAIGVSREK